jgi:poly-beta-1,6-N-acetyl-D-glucosamine synthase
MFPTTTVPPRAVTEGSSLVRVRTDRAFTEAVTQVLGAIEAEPAYAAEPYRRRGAPLVVAVIPAWNEAACIADTIDGLRHQTRPPDLIVVCANNCTDNTAAVARAAGVDVIDMPVNPDRKAGALNYAMETILPSLADRDRIFVQDADTVCVPAWLELACAVMDDDPRAVVSGRYACKTEYGLIGMMQRNEFTRECRRIDRRGDRTHILVGTSTLLPVAMLREVIAARRAGELPTAGYAYAPASLTEDYELTLAAKTLGWRTFSPRGCDAITDVMPSLSKLWHQRIRWWKGGAEDLRRYGLTRVTRGYIWRQSVMGLCLASLILYLATLAATYIWADGVHWTVAWLGITAIFVVNRVVEVRRAGPAAMLVAGLLVFELAYDLFQQTVFVVSLVKAWRRDPAVWVAT